MESAADKVTAAEAGKEQGTYHWDDMAGEDGSVVVHAADNPHEARTHRQKCTFEDSSWGGNLGRFSGR